MRTPTNYDTGETTRIGDRVRYAVASLPIEDSSFSRVMDHVQRSERRLRRNRAAARVSASFLLTVVIGGGTVAVNEQRSQRQPAPPAATIELASDAAAEPLRLIPDFMPDGLSVRHVNLDRTVSRSATEGFVGLWGADGLTVQIHAMPTSRTPTYLTNLETVLANDSNNESESLNNASKSLSWITANRTQVHVTLGGSTSATERAEVARSVVVKPDGTFTVEPAPLGLPQLALSTELPEPPPWLVLGAGNRFQFSAHRISEESRRVSALLRAETLNRANTEQTPQNTVLVRGTLASVARSAFDFDQVSVSGATVSWEERGWSYSAWLRTGNGQTAQETEDELRKIVQSLRPATAQEWEALDRSNGPHIDPDSVQKFAEPSSDVAADPRMFGEINGSAWSVSFADALTPQGCLNVVFHFDSTQEKCFEPNDQPVAFTTIRKIGGSEVLIAFLNETIDVVTVDGSEDEGEQLIPDDVIATTKGNTTTYLGVIAIPIRPGIPVVIRASRFVEPDSEVATIIGTFPVR